MLSLPLQDQNWTFRRPGTSARHPAPSLVGVSGGFMRNDLISIFLRGDGELGMCGIEEGERDYRYEFTLKDAGCAHRRLELASEGLDTPVSSMRNIY